MLTAKSFLAQIEAFLERQGMSATAFGSEAVKDPNFVSDLRAGRMPSLRLVERVDEFMRAHKRPKSSQNAEARL